MTITRLIWEAPNAQPRLDYFRGAEHRAGGPAARYGIHQRYRHYLVDGLMTVAVGLTTEGDPDLQTVVHALRSLSGPCSWEKDLSAIAPLLDPARQLWKERIFIHTRPCSDLDPIRAGG